jgi:hypothetical protein
VGGVQNIEGMIEGGRMGQEATIKKIGKSTER